MSNLYFNFENSGIFVSENNEISFCIKGEKVDFDTFQDWYRQQPKKPACEHNNRTQMQGLLENYDKCDDCGLEIPHHFPYQWNF